MPDSCGRLPNNVLFENKEANLPAPIKLIENFISTPLIFGINSEKFLIFI